MKALVVVLILSLALINNCKKKEEAAPPTDVLGAQVGTNLSVVAAGMIPAPLATLSSSSVTQQADPCANTNDFAVCQSNLIREYLKIGKSTVTTISSIVTAAGNALGGIADGSSGTSADGKISWNKGSSSSWSILAKGANSAPYLYVSVANNVYTLKVDASVAETNPSSFKAEATVTFTDDATWDVDVFFYNDSCSSSDPTAPSRINIKIAKANGLASGKSMIYAPRWKKANATVTCSSGGSALAMYTEFVSNDTSAKANLYLAPADASFSSPSTWDLIKVCTNFTGVCDVTGGPGSSGLTQAAFGNPFCTTGSGATFNNSCPTNAAVNSAAFSGTSWVNPSTLSTKTVTVPSSL